MDDSSEDEISGNSDVDMQDSYFSDDSENEQQIAHKNKVALWKWKAKIACLLYMLIKLRPRKALDNCYRPVDVLPSYPDSRIKRQRRLAESQSEKNITALVSQLITDKPTPIAVEKREEVDDVTKEWRNYCKVFADKVAKIKSTSMKNDIRFKMEQMLYDAGKKEKEKAKMKKKKEEESLNIVNT